MPQDLPYLESQLTYNNFDIRKIANIDKIKTNVYLYNSISKEKEK